MEAWSLSGEMKMISTLTHFALAYKRRTPVAINHFSTDHFPIDHFPIFSLLFDSNHVSLLSNSGYGHKCCRIERSECVQ